jgi:hypothetical protein
MKSGWPVSKSSISGNLESWKLEVAWIGTAAGNKGLEDGWTAEERVVKPRCWGVQNVNYSIFPK